MPAVKVRAIGLFMILIETRQLKSCLKPVALREAADLHENGDK